MVKSRHGETSGVPVAIAVLGFLAFAAYWAWRLSIFDEVVEWVVVGGVIFLLSAVFYLKRRRQPRRPGLASPGSAVAIAEDRPPVDSHRPWTPESSPGSDAVARRPEVGP